MTPIIPFYKTPPATLEEEKNLICFPDSPTMGIFWYQTDERIVLAKYKFWDQIMCKLRAIHYTTGP